MSAAASQTEHIKTIRELLNMAPDFFDAPVEIPARLTGEKSGVNTVPSFEEVVHEIPQPQASVAQATAPSVAVPEIEYLENQRSSRARRFFMNDYVRYPAIFLLSVGLFYLLLNFPAIWSQLDGVFNPPPENKAVVLGNELPKYESWISKYYVYVGEKQILQPNNDADQDGLTNQDEFYLGTNPLNFDTDGDGFGDGREVVNGYNPLYQGKLTQGQNDILGQKLDLVAIQSRLQYQNGQGGGTLTRVAGQTVANDFVVDTTREGRVEIPKIGVDAPLIWNKNFDWIQDDLKHGVVHHPDTVLPGQPGMVSIHGHSSGYPWDGNYKYAFTKINLLEAGDEVFVTVYNAAGESRRYRYVVRSKQVYEVNDPAQFADEGGYDLNLSTSWPVGTAQKRYVVTTELAGL